MIKKSSALKAFPLLARLPHCSHAHSYRHFRMKLKTKLGKKDISTHLFFKSCSYLVINFDRQKTLSQGASFVLLSILTNSHV